MKILIRLIFSLIILLSYSSKALSQDPPSEIVNHGAFSTMMIAAPDIAKYLETVLEGSLPRGSFSKKLKSVP